METKRAAELEKQKLDKENKEKEKTGEIPHKYITATYEHYLMLEVCEANGHIYSSELKKFKNLSSKVIDVYIKEDNIKNVTKVKDVSYNQAQNLMTTKDRNVKWVRIMRGADPIKGRNGCKGFYDNLYQVMSAGLPVEKPSKKRDF